MTTSEALALPRPPRQQYRVEFLEGYGYDADAPNLGCVGHRFKVRRYDDRIGAARMVRTILEWPTHHVLLAVRLTPCEWETVTVDVLEAAGEIAGPNTEVPDDDES